MDEALVTLAQLRGPLAPLDHVAQLLSTGAMDDKGLKRTGEVLKRRNEQMTTLVDDLLVVSRVPRGLAVLHVAEASAHQIVSGRVANVAFQSRAVSRSIKT
jgi:signal transduction histidine kinase